MQTKIFAPKSKRLQQFIEYFWLLTDSPGPEPYVPILPPEAAFDLVLSFGAPTVWQIGQRGVISLKGSFLGGIRGEPYFINSQGPVEYLAIRFFPDGLYPFLSFPLLEIFNQVVELDLLTQPLWKRLSEKLGNIPDVNRRVDALETELLSLLNATEYDESHLLKPLLAQIHASGGLLHINDLSYQFNLYPKCLEREFKKYIGVTPKFYSQIVRFSGVLDYLHRPGNPDWADIAYTCGYFDQAHFIKEFTRFVGQSPEQYQTAFMQPEPL